MDPLVTETSEFWRNAGEANDVDPSKIQTEVFRLPTTCFAEEDGALVNSGRWLQWHWKGAEPPGEAKSDIEIMSLIFTRLRKMYQDEGGKYPDPIVNLSWPYSNPQSPTAEELAKEYGQGARRPGRSQGSDQDHAQGRRAAGRLRRAARRRFHRQRLLDLRRRLEPGGQPDGAPRQQRSHRHRPDPELGLGMAGQPPHSLQPRVL